MKNILKGFWGVFNPSIIYARQHTDAKLINYFINAEENMVKAFNKLKDKYERE